MIVIFPFEEKLYRDAGVPVEFVGHPLLDVVPAPNGAKPEPTIVGILPGSRLGELRRHIPVMYAAFERLRAKHPEIRAQVFAASGRADGDYSPLPTGAELVRDVNYEKRSRLTLALCSSGTATLETALLGIPMVVIYKMSSATYLIARALVNVKNIAMANILAGKTVVPELIQGNATPEKIAAAADEFLTDANLAAKTRSALVEIRSGLGKPGACERAAEAVLRELNARPAAS